MAEQGVGASGRGREHPGCAGSGPQTITGRRATSASWSPRRRPGLPEYTEILNGKASNPGQQALGTSRSPVSPTPWILQVGTLLTVQKREVIANEDREQSSRPEPASSKCDVLLSAGPAHTPLSRLRGLLGSASARVWRAGVKSVLVKTWTLLLGSSFRRFCYPKSAKFPGRWKQTQDP